MAAPNIVNVTSITGMSVYLSNLNITTTVLFNNPASSNTVLKINTLIASNTTATSKTITVKLFDQAAAAGSAYSIGTLIAIAAGQTVTIIGKNTPLYLEENKSIGVLASDTNSIDVIGSYELIS